LNDQAACFASSHWAISVSEICSAFRAAHHATLRGGSPGTTRQLM
jgi:hypothetical protein